MEDSGTLNYSVSCAMLPDLLAKDSVAGSVAVVIDVLRATTTIAHALAHGARGVVPFVNIDDALSFKASTDSLIGGERGGIKIHGFDLGNSPSEYSQNVAGRLIGITTTNGTVAMDRCRAAARVVIASFVNLTATVNYLISLNARSIVVVCAGTDGAVAREDVLCAGAIIDRLTSAIPTAHLNDQAFIAQDAWRAVQSNIHTATLEAVLSQGSGGQNVILHNTQSDIALAADVDRFAVAVELNVADWMIRCVPMFGAPFL